MKNKIRYAVIFVIPLIMAFIGYYFVDGVNAADSLYGAISLYVLSPVLDCKNIWIYIARMVAPVMTVSGLAVVMRRASRTFKVFFMSLRPGATAVYCDNEAGLALEKNIKKGIVVSGNAAKNFPDHVIMFSNDEDNMRFYERNKRILKGKNVYCKSDLLDMFRTDDDNIKFFNINEIIAERYWIDRNLIKYYSGGMKLKIAIVGFGQLGQKILTYGIQKNIYSLNQSIEYHVWGDHTLYKNLHSGLELMNGDKIVYHNGKWDEDINLIASTDRVIITDQNEELLFCLGELYRGGEIDCFDPEKTVSNLHLSVPVYYFGQYEDILTEENVKTDNLYKAAKKLNYAYAVKYQTCPMAYKTEEENTESEWKKLDSFTKGSNITAASYHEIRLLIMKENGITEPDDSLAEMEHIRWCRYHYLNHWQYSDKLSVPKDSSKKLHTLLVTFDSLPQADKDKDIDLISCLLELYPA